VQGCFAVGVVDSPDAVELLLGPGVVGGSGSESGGELGDLSVVPAYKDDFSGVVAAEEFRGKVGVFVVFEVLVDLEMERVCQRDHSERGAVGVGAGCGGEDELGRGEVGSYSEGDEGFEEELGAGVAFGGEGGVSFGRFFGVADDEDGGGWLWAGGGLGVASGRALAADQGEGKAEDGDAGETELGSRQSHPARIANCLVVWRLYPQMIVRPNLLRRLPLLRSGTLRIV